MKICYITYTNSKCSDVWDIFIKQQNKYTNLPLFFISDKPIPGYEEKTFIYDNDDNYSSTWVNTLKKLEYDFFIYLQEDFFLYEKVNEEKLFEYVQFLEKNEEYSFVRLIKSGYLGEKRLSETLYKIESSNSFIFAMQATIWKKTEYIHLLERVQEPKWLETNKYREIMGELNMIGAYHYDNELKRGGCHYDSSVYPYIATALVKGKWILSEYGDILQNILKEHNVDVNKRGVC